jgi:hypothetical protein
MSVAGLLAVWTERRPIAQRFVEDQLVARHVRATYDIKQIALRTQRIENLVLGDPANPDLTARSVEVDISYRGLMPRVGAVRARGVRMYGKVDGSGLHVGELDKFRDPRSTAPFNMPDIDLTLTDARALFDTPVGRAGLVVSGSGNLQSGFAGKVAALIHNAAFGECTVPTLSGWMDLRMMGGAPRLSGPMRANAVKCASNISAARLVVNADVTLTSDLANWRGSVKGGAEAARASGATLAQLGVDMKFQGNAAGISGEGALRLAGLKRDDVRAGKGRINTRWRWSRRAGMEAEAQADISAVRLVKVRSIDRLAASTATTPVGPLLKKLGAGMAALQNGSRLKTAFAVKQAGESVSLRASLFSLSGSRGARVSLSDESVFAVSLPDGRWTLDGALTSGGGGLPEVALRLRQGKGGGLSGQMFMQPYSASGARLEAREVRFRSSGGGSTHISTVVRLDGPLPDGAIRGLAVPVEAVWNARGIVVNPECMPASFSTLTMGSLKLDAAKLSLCPVDSALLASRNGRMTGGAQIAAPRLTGRIGSSPMQLDAKSARYVLGSGGFDLVEVDLRLGDKEAPVLFSAAHLAGASLRKGLGGSADGITARIGTVPLLVRDGAARWTFAGGALALDGSIIVYDDANPDRFNPLQSSDFKLRLANGRIDAGGTLHLPGGTRQVASVQVRHLLGSGVGHADLNVDGLRFDEKLQPDQLTYLALGVVANVDGTVTGSGQIDWSPQRVTSTGEFATQDMNLAAAFGPVQGLSTRIHFTDLIGLVTAPGQEMRIVSVNPGIEVRDGVIRYALLPAQRVAIESAHWPLAGGDLTMLPTVMDMGAERARRLAFRVVGLDAGAFIQKMELENISATGTFDGLLPMVFDAQGGRIEGGILNARQIGMPPLVINHVEGLDIPCDRERQGGTLSYVGQVSNENLGFMGKLAFDALKDLQYKCLTILMDGAIDGEMVSQVTFNGVNRGALSNVPKPIAAQFIGLPFIFNIKIQAPFRGLLNTARSFVDPSLLIRQQLGQGVTTIRQNGATENGLAVQPGESDTMSSGERK